MSKLRTRFGSPSLRVASYSLAIACYLTWIAGALSVALLVAVTTTDFRIKYVHIPIEVDFRETESFLDAGGSSDLAAPLYCAGGESVDAAAAGGCGVRSVCVCRRGDLAEGCGRADLFDPAPGAGVAVIVSGRDPQQSCGVPGIGWAVTAAGPVLGILNNIYGRLFINMVDVPGAELDASMEVYPFVIFLGLVIVVIAHVFDHGVRLQTEQDLTV